MQDKRELVKEPVTTLRIVQGWAKGEVPRAGGRNALRGMMVCRRRQVAPRAAAAGEFDGSAAGA